MHTCRCASPTRVHVAALFCTFAWPTHYSRTLQSCLQHLTPPYTTAVLTSTAARTRSAYNMQASTGNKARLPVRMIYRWISRYVVYPLLGLLDNPLDTLLCSRTAAVIWKNICHLNVRKYLATKSVYGPEIDTCPASVVRHAAIIRSVGSVQIFETESTRQEQMINLTYT